ncbi:MAG TPA: pirin family protein [Planctomycetota bacterium]|nr:pirin family protein [Planctomycetota bacterium]
MITLRPSNERGHADHGWLDARHTFSFADYHDPAHMHFGHLRVLNQDRIAPGAGFPPHGHRDMEIVTWVLQGALQHRDSMGNGSVIRPGEAQHMGAGSGVQHSEFNASQSEPLHLLQMWVLPAVSGGAPRYGQLEVSQDARLNRFALTASPDGADGSLVIGQDARLYVADLAAGASLSQDLDPARRAWLHVATGRVRLGERELGPGDGAGLEREAGLELVGVEPAQLVLWDLA